MTDNNSIANLTRGIFRENPIFVMMLGMCPTLGVTTSLVNGLGMGIATLAVLIMSNMAIALVKNVIPNEVRIPCFVVIIATFVTVLQLVMEAYVPVLFNTLGIFIPLIVVNCLILGRAEAFASKNNVFQSILDAIGMGLGFTLALASIGFVRELLGEGAILGHKIFNSSALIFIMPPGAFLVLAGLIVLMNKIRSRA